MISHLHKKTISFLFAIVVSVACFGAFMNVANAATSQLSKDISLWLLENYSIDIPATSLSSVPEIPSDLYDPVNQWQADKVTTNIKKDPIVTSRVSSAVKAQDDKAN